jgi:hypothetical protein
VSEEIQVRSNSSPYTFDWSISYAEFLFHVVANEGGRSVVRMVDGSLFSDGQSSPLSASALPFGSVNFFVTASTFSSLRQLFRRVE